MHYRGNGLPERKPEYRLGVIGISIALLACVIAAWGQDVMGEVVAYTSQGTENQGTEKINSHGPNEGYNEKAEGFVGIAHTHSYTNQDGVDRCNKHHHKSIVIVDGDYVYEDSSHQHDGECVNGEEHNGECVNGEGHDGECVNGEEHNGECVNGEGHDGEVDEPETPDPELPTSRRSPVNSCDPEPITPVSSVANYVGRYSHEWDFNESPFIGFPVMPGYTRTIKRLWNRLLTAVGSPVPIFIQVSVDGNLQIYQGEDNELGQMKVTPHLGVVLSFYRGTARFTGNRVRGEEITLEMNGGGATTEHLIGFPEVPTNFERYSDLLSDELDMVYYRVRIDGKLQSFYIRDADDEGDALIEAGQAVIVRIRNEVTLDLSGSVMAAPMARRIGTLATSWGGLKRIP